MDDLLAGKKEILAFLRCERWSRVEQMRKHGLPVVKVVGRWEARKSSIQDWYAQQEQREQETATA